MEIPDELLCLYSAEVEQQGDSYSITVPKQELSDGAVNHGAAYRVALLSSQATATENETQQPNQPQNQSKPPVAEGDRRIVEIEDIGEQGDGIARVERGYVIIVPDTEKHDRVTIEITNVADNVAFAEVVGQKVNYA